MALRVAKVASIVDREIVFSPRSPIKVGDLVGLLTNVRGSAAGDGPSFSMEIQLSEGPKTQVISMPIEAFLSAAEYNRSFMEPLPFTAIEAVLNVAKRPSDRTSAIRDRMWLFRDDLYAPTRKPRESERDEIVLRIKALHFRSTQNLKRLKEQVANFEAIETTSKRSGARQRIPDDVRLLVWTRDSGACVKCGASTNLHFDHIIPLSKGGGDHAENIQLLCRTCNLAKHSRLT